MRILLTVIFVIGLLFVVSGIYEQKVLDALASKRIEYRFIPRTMFEEQMDSTSVTSATQQMFRDAPLITGGRQATLQ